MILEEFVAGRELELAVLGNEDVRGDPRGRDHRQPGVLRLRGQVRAGTRRDGGADRPDGRASWRTASSWSRSAYRALRVEGLARIDVFLREDDEIVINEVNTMPGFTPISMFPMLWEAEGVPFRRWSRNW